MNLVPARCERSREWVSLRLDGQLSTFEAAMLERHLRRCPSCRGFAARAAVQTQLLRGAVLEEPSRPVFVPAPVARPRRSRLAAVGMATTLAAAVAAAALVVVPSTQQPPVNETDAATQPALFVFPARPDPTAKVEVPRLKVMPPSIADGPIHGPYSLPA